MVCESCWSGARCSCCNTTFCEDVFLADSFLCVGSCTQTLQCDEGRGECVLQQWACEHCVRNGFVTLFECPSCKRTTCAACNSVRECPNCKLTLRRWGQDDVE